MLTSPNAHNLGARVNSNRHALEAQKKKTIPMRQKRRERLFFLIFRHIGEKDADVDAFNASQRFPLLFFKRRLKRIILLTTKRCEKTRAKALDCKH